MTRHRFYVAPERLELTHGFWVNDAALVHQWLRVLRLRPGQELILFDGEREDRLYKIAEVEPAAVHLELVTELQRSVPKRDMYLLWSLLKKDKNDWVLQKGTELGVRHFVPLLSERTEKTGFDMDRAERIVIEAAEQCGRSDIPRVREPLKLETAIAELSDNVTLFVAQQGSEQPTVQTSESIGVLIGPEGGWSDAEKALFEKLQLPQLQLHDFTLRAETAALAAVTQLLR